MTFNIGIGFNLANSEPTLSFNDLLKKQGLSPLDPETYFAKFFNCLEKFLDMLETDDGKNNILQLYHQYWLHQGKLLKGIDNCSGVKQRYTYRVLQAIQMKLILLCVAGRFGQP